MVWVPVMSRLDSVAQWTLSHFISRYSGQTDSTALYLTLYSWVSCLSG